MSWCWNSSNRFEQRSACTLLVFIDDATCGVMQPRFVRGESTGSYFQALREYLGAHGGPVAFYSNKRAVLRINRDAQGGSRMTQLHESRREKTTQPCFDDYQGTTGSKQDPNWQTNSKKIGYKKSPCQLCDERYKPGMRQRPMSK